MTITSTISRVTYPGAGSVGPFAFPFRIFAATDLNVQKIAVGGVISLLSYSADYSVPTTSIGANTGTLTLTVALATGETLVIRRLVPITQPTSIRNQGSYFPSTIEDEFDRLTAIDQQQQDQLDRTLSLAPALDPTAYNLTLPVPTAGRVMTGTGTGFTMSTLDSSATALPGNGRTVATVSAYLLNNATFNVKDYGALGNGVADDLPSFNAAIVAAQAANQNFVEVPAGGYRLNGTLVIPQGVTVFARASTMGEYDGNSYTSGARLLRVTGDSGAVPLVELSTSSALLGVELRWQKAGGALQGVLRMGHSGSFITYARFYGMVRGTRTGDIDATTTCYGILFPNTADAKYFNDIDAYVSECDVSCRMGQLANANRVNLMSREAHLHLDLNAIAGQCIENDINIRMFSITVLTPKYGIRQHNSVNNKIRGIYESYGACFYADDSTSSDDVDVVVNEVTVSYVPLTSIDRRYTRPVNRQQYTSMLFPTRTTGDRNNFGRGNKVSFLKNIAGTLPNANNVAGTLIAADANNRVIVNMGSNFNKAGLISFKAKLSLWAYLPFNASMHWVEVEFIYRNTNQSTAAGSLSVLRVTQKGADITGLYFLTGVTGATNFAIALTMGNLGSATPPDVLSCELDITALTYSTNVVTMDDLAAQVSFTTAAVTANDVTNKISLLTVADTVV